MMLSLATVTLLSGIFLILPGAGYMFGGTRWQNWMFAFARSQTAALVTMILGGGAFLWKVWNLAEVDFGNYSVHLTLFFAVVMVGSFFVVRDFLAIRAAAILALVASLEILKAAFAQYDLPQRLFLVCFVYALIVLALLLGTVPFYWRNFHEWLYDNSAAAFKPRVLGSILAGYGLLLGVIAFTY